jgi:phosphoribosyl-AMP cyclohydrolase / phosphoribosyl-ATP pyrophosphohydrolase
MKLDSTDSLDKVRFDERGLVPVIAQHADTGEVLMLAYANREALSRTLDTGLLWFYSRSRQSLWQKGETSGNTQQLTELLIDCDGDAILARVLPAGPACHTGERNCFGSAPTLQLLGDVIEQRAQHASSSSYTTKLLNDSNLRLKKLGEEATELALACQSGSAGRVRSEAADLLYHVLVASAAVDVDLAEILGELRARFK